jgi:hypothetical protein
MGLDMHLINSDGVEVMYWRKANAIHKFFTDLDGGVDECQVIAVTGKDLHNLAEKCQKALDRPEEAHNILPTQSGFFFGSTEYDMYYFADLEDTVKFIYTLNPTDAQEFTYRASW